MKKYYKILSVTITLFLIVILGFFVFGKENGFNSLELVILFLVIALGGVFVFLEIKKSKEIKEGIPVEDELSNRIKYKSGHYSFLISMYMWLFIFLFRDKFPNTEVMLGGGIMLSALISFIVKFVIKKNFNE